MLLIFLVLSLISTEKIRIKFQYGHIFSLQPQTAQLTVAGSEQHLHLAPKGYRYGLAS